MSKSKHRITNYPDTGAAEIIQTFLAWESMGNWASDKFNHMHKLPEEVIRSPSVLLKPSGSKVLQHVLPKGSRRIRDYGLLSGNCSQLRQETQLMLAVAGALPQGVGSPIVSEVKRAVAIRSCPCCKQPMKFMGVHQNGLGNSRPTSLTITA